MEMNNSDIVDQTGGKGHHVLYTSKTTGRKYSGSGIILVEIYNNRAGRKEPAVILFKSIRKEGGIVYEGLGGRIDSSDLLHKYPLVITARREAYEESRGLISFSSAKHIGAPIKGNNIFVDRKYGEYYYRAYFVGIRSGVFSKKDYINNKIILDSIKNVYHAMKETHDVTRFYIRDLIKSGLLTEKNNLTTVDAYGKKATIFMRTVSLIRNAYKKGILNLVIKYPRKFIPLRNLISVK